MSSVHLYQAEKKDLQNIYDLLIEFKEVDLIDLKLPDVDKSKMNSLEFVCFTNQNFGSVKVK